MFFLANSRVVSSRFLLAGGFSFTDLLLFALHISDVAGRRSQDAAAHWAM